jgi:cephalosporin-C deacetylase-like acetyl esterase
MRVQLIKFLVGIVFVLCCGISVFAQDPEMVRHFDYDKSTPIDLKIFGTQKRGDVTVYDITYASPKGGVVPAYLVVPSGNGPFAAVIWGHWYWRNSEMRNRKQFLDEAVAMAPTGLVSLLTDGPVVRPGYVPNTTPLNEQQVTDLVQQVVDMRRGVDVLLSRKDVDPKRIAFVGHSYNASVGAILSGVDRRFKAFVLMAGTMSDEVDMKTGAYDEFRKKVGPEKFDAMRAKHAYTDQGLYVSHAAPAFVFMQYATQEDFMTPDRAREYEKVVSEPKRFKLYEATHALNADARRDRIAFLAEQLKLKPLSPQVIASIPDLVQPPREPNPK